MEGVVLIICKNGSFTFFSPTELGTNNGNQQKEGQCSDFNGVPGPPQHGEARAGNHLVYSPKGKNDETADEKYGRKDEEQGVAGLLPSSIRKHFSRLKTKREIIFT